MTSPLTSPFGPFKMAVPKSTILVFSPLAGTTANSLPLTDAGAVTVVIAALVSKYRLPVVAVCVTVVTVTAVKPAEPDAAFNVPAVSVKLVPSVISSNAPVSAVLRPNNFPVEIVKPDAVAKPNLA